MKFSRPRLRVLILGGTAEELLWKPISPCCGARKLLSRNFCSTFRLTFSISNRMLVSRSEEIL